MKSHVQIPLALFVLLLMVPGGQAAEPVGKVKKSIAEYKSRGETIQVTRYDPPGPGPHRTLILLHGLEGAEMNRETYENGAVRMANRGYTVFFFRYFDCFVKRAEDLKVLQATAPKHMDGPDCPGREKVWQLFSDCLVTVSDGIRYVHTQPGVDSKRVAILGFSLGGFLAVAAATDPELKIAAVVEMFGGLLRELHHRVGTLPPTFVIHGSQDRVVSVAAAQTLTKLLKAKQRVHQLQVYNVDHVFLTEKNEVNWFAAADAELRCIAFLASHLK